MVPALVAALSLFASEDSNLWRGGDWADEVGERVGGIPTSGRVLSVEADRVRIMQPDGAERTLLLGVDTEFVRDGAHLSERPALVPGLRVRARYVLAGDRSEATRIELREEHPSDSLGPALTPMGPGAAR